MASTAPDDATSQRRCIAEDKDWNLPIVPRLKDKCLEHIIANFATRPILNELPPKLQQTVIAKISLDVPLEVTAKLIEDEEYWKRQCHASWPLCDVSLHMGVWKNMFFEKRLEDMIAKFVPGKSDEGELKDYVELSRDMIRQLCIREMQVADGDERVNPPHLDPSLWLNKLHRLEKLSCTYSIEDSGMTFSWDQFGMKIPDAQAFGRVLTMPHCIRSLELHRSLIGDEEVRVLAASLLKNETLVCLSLAHNKIGDRGARAIAKLISIHGVLKEMNLSDNHIRAHGAKCISHALASNTELASLNLRLNRIGDEGAIALCEGLVTNTTVAVLNIASNSIGAETCGKLAELLKSNTTLHTISLNCNRFGVSGGNILREGIDANTRLQRVDLRLSDVGQETEFIIHELLKRNNSMYAQAQAI